MCISIFWIVLLSLLPYVQRFTERASWRFSRNLFYLRRWEKSVFGVKIKKKKLSGNTCVSL